MNHSENLHYFLVDANEELLTQAYLWMKGENSRDHFTCRPVSPLSEFSNWIVKEKTRMEKKDSVVKFLVNRSDVHVAIGRIRCFDFNPRNKSVEIGFFLPGENRKRGFGNLMIELMLAHMFNDPHFELNKIYATTAAINAPSIKLLENHGFHKDGENREHYWIDGKKYGQLVYSILRSEWETMDL